MAKIYASLRSLHGQPGLRAKGLEVRKELIGPPELEVQVFCAADDRETEPFQK